MAFCSSGIVGEVRSSPAAQAKAATVKLRADVEKLGKPELLPGAALTVKTSLEAMRDQTSATLADVQQVDAAGQLKSAFEKSSACGPLRPGSGG